MLKIICFLLALSLPGNALCSPLAFSKNSFHYMAELETWYQKPRPAILEEMVKAFAAGGDLARSENRLILAAFFSELIRAGQIIPGRLTAIARATGPDAEKMAAWALYLSGSCAWKDLPVAGDALLKKQIGLAPSDLLRWQVEPSVLYMLWAAFMASGKTAYLDKIIATALQGAHPGAMPVSGIAAASLYDYVPRHPLIRKRLQAVEIGKDGDEKKIIRTILEHAGQ